MLQQLSTNAAVEAAGFTGPEQASLGIATSIAEGRLFGTDYGVLQSVQNGTAGAPGKAVYFPTALFELPKSASAAAPGVLRPVAIKLRANGMEDVLVTPSDTKDEMWLKAKIITCNAGG